MVDVADGTGCVYVLIVNVAGWSVLPQGFVVGRIVRGYEGEEKYKR